MKYAEPIMENHGADYRIVITLQHIECWIVVWKVNAAHIKKSVAFTLGTLERSIDCRNHIVIQQFVYILIIISFRQKNLRTPNRVSNSSRTIHNEISQVQQKEVKSCILSYDFRNWEEPDYMKSTNGSKRLQLGL